jgi:hypothetical protein
LRYVDDLGLRWLQHDDLLAFLHLGLDLHLLGALQVADVDRLLAQALHGAEYAGLVRDEGLAQFGGPVELEAHHVDGLGELDQRANRRGESDGGRGVVERRALERAVLEQPVARVEHFLRIRGRDQHLRKHGVRIEGDGRQEILERLGRPGPGHFGRRHWGGRRRGRRRSRGRRLCLWGLLRAAAGQRGGGAEHSKER